MKPQPTFKDHEGNELRLDGVTVVDDIGGRNTVQIALSQKGIHAGVYDAEGEVRAEFQMGYEELATQLLLSASLGWAIEYEGRKKHEVGYMWVGGER